MLEQDRIIKINIEEEMTGTITRQTLKYKNKKIKTINIIWKDK